MTSLIRHLPVLALGAAIAAAGLLALLALAAAAVPGYSGVDFVTDTGGWVVGSDSTILTTSNGGKAWQTQAATPGGPTLLDVCVLADGKTGWAVGAAGAVLRTTDGAAWRAPALLRPASTVTAEVGGLAMAATKAATGLVIVGDYYLRAVDFTSDKTGYAVGRTSAGSAPTVLKTTNGASSWATVK